MFIFVSKSAYLDKLDAENVSAVHAVVATVSLMMGGPSPAMMVRRQPLTPCDDCYVNFDFMLTFVIRICVA
jgi:hypothetical protein